MSIASDPAALGVLAWLGGAVVVGFVGGRLWGIDCDGMPTPLIAAIWPVILGAFLLALAAATLTVPFWGPAMLGAWFLDKKKTLAAELRERSRP